MLRLDVVAQRERRVTEVRHELGAGNVEQRRAVRVRARRLRFGVHVERGDLVEVAVS